MNAYTENTYFTQSFGENQIFLYMKQELLRLKLHTRHQIGRLIFIREREDDYEIQEERN